MALKVDFILDLNIGNFDPHIRQFLAFLIQFIFKDIDNRPSQYVFAFV